MTSNPQLTFIIADLSRFTAHETLALALDIQANLQEDTPRDTGWARSNWVPSVGAPHFDPSVPEVKNPEPQQVAGAVQKQTEATATLSGYTIAQGAIFTTNNVPYITALNEGHSPQAGRGFVQRSVGRALRERDTR